MNEDQATRVREWLEQKWNHGPCPVCSDDSWSPAPNLGQIPNLVPMPPEGGRTVPVLVMACNTCGYLVLINAIGAGIIASDEAAPSDAVAPSELPGEIVADSGGDG